MLPSPVGALQNHLEELTVCEEGRDPGAAAAEAAATGPIGTDVAAATTSATDGAAAPASCATAPATGEPHAPPAAAAAPEDAGSCDDDVSPPVADALAFLRDRVPPDSLVLLSTRGNSLDSLGAKDTEAVRPVMKEVIGALTAARGKLLMFYCPEVVHSKGHRRLTPLGRGLRQRERLLPGCRRALLRWKSHQDRKGLA